ncbi:MAG: XcyI family restriction endonuclease [Armatimonadota bacterium]
MKAPIVPDFPVLTPDLQVSFFYRLQTVRRLHLSEPLGHTIKQMDISQLDDELAEYVPAGILARLAALGLRGERVFPVPGLLRANPRLLGYYRLLYGFSEKALYGAKPFSRFAKLERDGKLPDELGELLPDLCRSLVASGQLLLEGVGDLTQEDILHLQLLTCGAGWRGSELNRIGQAAVLEVYAIIEEIVGPHVTSATPKVINLRNTADRAVSIVFADDPDVRVVEHLPSGEEPKISMEIKGGLDASNVYNRIGEAEKSHLKAKQTGFFEFWTLVRASFDSDRAKIDSPTTGYFFDLGKLIHRQNPDYRRFRERLSSVLSIKIPEETDHA